MLRVGSYDADALQEAGAKNDDISSVTVSDGCQVTLYENGDMTGWNATFEPGMYDVNQMTAGGAKNDQTSSVVVCLIWTRATLIQCLCCRCRCMCHHCHQLCQ